MAIELRTIVLAALALTATLPYDASAQMSRGRGDFEKAVPTPEPLGAPPAGPVPTAPINPPPPQRVQPAPPRPPAAQAPSAAPARPGGAPVIIWNPGGQRAETPGRATPETEARAAAEAFYRTALQVRAMGIPNATQRSRLRAHLSPSLEAELAAAAQAEQAYRNAAPGEPPLHDGDLFSALQAGPRAASLRACEVIGDQAICTAQLNGAEGSKPWQDKLIFVRTPAGWRLDDVTYGGRFANGNLGTLRELLTVLIRQTAPTPAPPGATEPRDPTPQ